jgi:hypothetical protein
VNKNNENSHYVNLILKRLKSELRIPSNVQLARRIGIKPSTLAMQIQRGSLDLFRLITTCKGVNWNWVLDINTESTNDPILDYDSFENTDMPDYVRAYVHQKEQDFRIANEQNLEFQKENERLQHELKSALEQVNLLKEVIASLQNQ